MCTLLVLLLFLTFVNDVRGLRNVSLQLFPPVVERGNTVELICRYDLQGDPLYTIKFYRGTYEFYRYTPNDHPPIKTFLFKGLDVDLSSSQGRPSSVVVQNVGYNLAGNVSCEVSTDTSFSTMMSTKYLTVVELPKKPPDIHIDSSPRSGGVWEAGDILNATCTSAPARPAPSLFWFINDEPGLTMFPRKTQSNSLETRSVTLSAKLLPRHVMQGSLVIKCTAMVLDVYKETSYKVMRLGMMREPRHERVQSSSSANRVRFFADFVITTSAVWTLAFTLTRR